MKPHLMGVAGLVLALAGCAGSGNLGASDPVQQVYALETEYTVAASAELAFVQSPAADPADIAAVREADQSAYAALVAARQAAETGANGTGISIAAALAGAQSGIADLTNLLVQKGIAK